MTLEVAPIVKDAGNLDHAIFDASIEKEMPGLLHTRAAYPAPAERKMISSGAWDHYVGPFLRTRTFGIGFVAYRCRLPEFLETPFHDSGYVTASGAGNVNFEGEAF